VDTRHAHARESRRGHHGRPDPMRLSARLSLALLLAALPAAAAPVSVRTERRGDAVEIRASAALNADVATAWRVLTDYEGYTRFIPDLRTSRVVARRGGSVTVEQSGDARVWLLRFPLDITFEISESPMHSLHSRAVAGSMRMLESRYLLTPTSSGTRLEYTGRVAPGFEFFGRIEEHAVGENVARRFQALADEIERGGADEGSGRIEGVR